MIFFCDFIIFNEYECLEFFLDKKLEEIIKIYFNKMIVILGVEGFIYYDGAVVQKIFVIKVEVVDIIGVGDMFNGVFVYVVLKGKEMNVVLFFVMIVLYFFV